MDNVAEITACLEDFFGVPQWNGRGNPLSSMIKTILSQNTNDKNRDMAYHRLKERYPDWSLLLDEPTSDIADTIRPAGLANQKSERIQKFLHWIVERTGELNLDFLCEMQPDHAIETFTQLKGIGIKTIAVVLMFTCGVDIFPVDTHVHRICRKLNLVPENASAEKTHFLMQPLVPDGKSFSLHMNFLKLGRTICKARQPLCGKCPIAHLCPSRQTAS
ncbi:endonuclease III [candidate division KSB1 bacterium]|nr:endonuclease III [candidate division KSB1 bacterium]